MSQTFWSGSGRNTATSGNTLSVNLVPVSGHGKLTRLDRVLIAIANSMFMSPIRKRWLYGGASGMETRNGYLNVTTSMLVTGTTTTSTWRSSGESGDNDQSTPSSTE